MMKPLFLLISLLLMPILTKASEVVEVMAHQSYKRFDYNLHAKSLNQANIPTFIYQSNSFDPKLEAKWILFLHGRGYAREVGARDSMLEHLQISRLLEENPQVIFVAPQDVFFHQDSNSIGQDYWLGAAQRNWQTFLGKELPIHIDTIKEQLEISGNLETVIGISMGAHGALSLGDHFPNQYKNVAALSPVFRPVESEIPTQDYDVFQPHNKEYMTQNNVGAKILERQYSLPNHVFITISKSDFGLDEKKFPMAIKCWDQLLKLQSQKSLVEVSDDTRGHAAGFWIDQLPRALDFFFLP